MSSPMDKTRRDRLANNPGNHPLIRDYIKTLEEGVTAFTTTTSTTTTSTTTTSTTTTTTA